MISDNKEELPFVYTNVLHEGLNKRASSPEITNNDFLGNLIFSLFEWPLHERVF